MLKDSETVDWDHYQLKDIIWKIAKDKKLKGMHTIADLK